jgi:hypothetical protein
VLAALFVVWIAPATPGGVMFGFFFSFFVADALVRFLKWTFHTCWSLRRMSQHREREPQRAIAAADLAGTAETDASLTTPSIN